MDIAVSAHPPLPPGFTLDQPGQQDLPPLPPGFKLDSTDQAAPRDPNDPPLLPGEAGFDNTPSKEPSMFKGVKKYAQGVNEAAGEFNRAKPAGLLGVGDAALSAVTGMLAPGVGAIRSKITGEPYEKAAEASIYQPRTESGRAQLGMLGALTAPLSESGADIALVPLAAEMQALSAARRPKAVPAPVAVPKAAVPTTTAISDASQAAYKRAADAGVVIAPQSLTRAAQAVRQAAARENLNPKLHPKAAAAVEHLEEIAAKGEPLSLEQADQLRQVIKDAESSIDKADRRMGGVMRRRFDTYLEQLGPQDTLAGRTPEALEALKDARALYRRKGNSEMLDEMVRKAEVNAGAKYTQAGMEHALRSEFKKLSLNEKKMRMFVPEQRAAIEKVAKGGPVENFMRNVGKFDPTQGGMSAVLASTLGGSAGFAAGGPAGMGAGMGAMSALGYVARRGATRATVKNVARAREALVGRGLPSAAAVPLQASAPAANRIAQLAPQKLPAEPLPLPESALRAEALEARKNVPDVEAVYSPDELAAPPGLGNARVEPSSTRGMFDVIVNGRRVVSLPSRAEAQALLEGLDETPAPASNRLSQLAPEDTFAAERAAAAESARGGYAVDESPGEAITLETRPRRAARSAGAIKSQAMPTVPQIESDMVSLMRRARSMRPDSPELIELDAQFQTLQAELEMAKQRSKPRNRIARLAGGE